MSIFLMSLWSKFPVSGHTECKMKLVLHNVSSITTWVSDNLLANDRLTVRPAHTHEVCFQKAKVGKRQLEASQWDSANQWVTPFICSVLIRLSRALSGDAEKGSGLQCTSETDQRPRTVTEKWVTGLRYQHGRNKFANGLLGKPKEDDNATQRTTVTKLTRHSSVSASQRGVIIKDNSFLSKLAWEIT